MKRFRIILIVAIVMAFSAIPVFSGPPTGVVAPPEMRMLQASPQPPKEIQDLEAQAKKMTEIPLGRQLTKGELEQKLQLIPTEREKLNNAKANRKGNLTIMAAPQPPREIQDLETQAKKMTEIPLGRQLTTGELEQKLQLIPAEQGKLQRIKQGYKPTSQARETGFSLSWLNPFRVTEAWASTFDVTLSPANGWYLHTYPQPVPAYAIFGGALTGAYYSKFPTLGSFYYVNNMVPAYKGQACIGFYAPVAGYYIIDVVAGNKNRASLVSSSSGVAVATWDFASSTTSWNDHVTIQYLNVGGHWFLFKPEYNVSGSTPVSSIRITSYP